MVWKTDFRRVDYFFVSRGNIVLSDLYTSNPKGMYWYTGGWNWRAYAAYCVGLALAFPGLVGSLGVQSLGEVTSPAHQMFTCESPVLTGASTI